MKYFFYAVPVLLLLLASCSVPNLEQPECSEARTEVRQFYSFHFGNDMHPTAANLKLREKFLTGDLLNTMAASNETKVDYFTGTDDYPKAFRLGTCKVVSPTQTEFQVLLFWRDDTRSEQKEIKAEAVKVNDKWLVNKVFR
jgi:hypothetical protein